MASYLSKFRETVTVNLDEETWVTVSKQLNKKDSDACQRLLFGGSTMDMQAGQIQSEPDVVSFLNEQVIRSLVDWNITDEAGVKLPLMLVPGGDPYAARRESVDMLPQEAFALIAAAVQAGNAPREGAEKAKF